MQSCGSWDKIIKYTEGIISANTMKISSLKLILKSNEKVSSLASGTIKRLSFQQDKVTDLINNYELSSKDMDLMKKYRKDINKNIDTMLEIYNKTREIIDNASKSIENLQTMNKTLKKSLETIKEQKKKG